MRGGLLSLLADVSRRQDVNDHQPAPGSPAALDVADEPTFAAHIVGRPVVLARQMGAVQLHAAADQFGAMCRLLELEATVLFADKVLARAGIEAAARALWLLDPGISTRARVARGLSERLHDSFQAGQLFGDEGQADRHARREALLQQARAAGFTCETPKKSPAYVIGEPRPHATQAMQSLLDAEPTDGDDSLGRGTQRYLSSFVHATSLGLHSTFSVAEAVVIDHGVSSAPLVSDSGTVARLTAICSLAWMLVATPYLTYMGWRDPAWDRTVANHSALMRNYL